MNVSSCGGAPGPAGEPLPDAPQGSARGAGPGLASRAGVAVASSETLTAAHSRALSRSLPRAVFTSDLFSTGNDRDNRAAVRAVGKDQLDLVGLALHGPRNAVDKVLKGARMHS
ncbi:DUF2000 family protein [Streptomyces sp. A5-4]|uniref:DUF2000 family protein n=1 Tax=Streptomyces sp. A5-4 TaxID=3384771 RepID=UPI003DA99D28